MEWKRCQGNLHVLFVGCQICCLQYFVVGPGKIPSFLLCFAHSSLPLFPLPQTKTQAKAKKMAEDAKAKANKAQADAKVLLKKDRK